MTASRTDTSSTDTSSAGTSSAGTSSSGTVPTVWDDARDVPFFRATARLFPPAFCLGATVLLASYDDEPARTAVAAPAVDVPVPVVALPAARAPGAS